jgi:DNA-directed RNA polymerase specialized sigma24 family protein
VGPQRPDFAEFYRSTKDECLRTVLVSVGDRDTAQDLVDEAFTRACASWRTVSRHPAPAAWVVRTAEVLGVAPSTVKAHLARAIVALRDDLVPIWQQETSS